MSLFKVLLADWKYVRGGVIAKVENLPDDKFAHAPRDFRGRGEKLMESPIRQFNGEYASRLSWLHHGIAHEEYHRGHLAIYARLGGENPALTKLIEGG